MDQDFHLIEKYFRGELNEEELQLFNSKLQNDSAFEQEFRDMKLVKEGAKASARIKALSILQDVEANLTEKETTKINVSMRRLVSIAASLIVIATVSYFAISNRTGGTMTGDEVFASYYEPYINLRGAVRGENIEINTLSARAYNAYDIEDFSTSANLFAELLDVEKSAENFFYSGIANLESGNLDVAKANFNTVMNNYTELREQSQWYLAMTLFKDGAEDEAAVNLGHLVLSKSNSKITRDSKSVLEEIGFSLSMEGETGETINPELVPPTDEKPGVTVEELRRTQFGKVLHVESGKIYNFHNDYPIDGLEDGDLVEFVLLRGKTKDMSIAIILDKL